MKTHEPKEGRQGKEIKSNVTDNESAKMATSHGVIQGYNAQAFVDDKHQIIMAAEVFGDGSDAGLLSTMLAGVKRNMQILGHGEDYLKGKKMLADTGYHSEENLKSCDEEQLEGYIPDAQFRKRDSRFASRKSSNKPTKNKLFPREYFHYSAKLDGYICPNGKILRLRIREHRNKSDGQRSFGKQPPEEIGDSKRDKKGVCGQPGPEILCHYHVADKAEDPAEQGE